MAGLGTMAAKVAHEIRNPLASISGSAQLLRDASFKNESDLKLLGLIVTESARLDRILSGLLDYSRDSRPAYREVSLNEIFQKIALMLEKSPTYDKKLVITTHLIENGDIRFISDQDILVQVLLNVALNALQALPEGRGTLEFTATKMGKNVVIKVRDNGKGMSPQEAARAFEPFFTSKAAGTGLGLSTCLHYVQSLDGNIILESEKESGTVVSITLPVMAPKLD
jgi:two-component system sensor histidine kinase PilS (NtrC family)